MGRGGGGWGGELGPPPITFQRGLPGPFAALGGREGGRSAKPPAAPSGAEPLAARCTGVRLQKDQPERSAGVGVGGPHRPSFCRTLSSELTLKFLSRICLSPPAGNRPTRVENSSSGGLSSPRGHSRRDSQPSPSLQMKPAFQRRRRRRRGQTYSGSWRLLFCSLALPIRNVQVKLIALDSVYNGAEEFIYRAAMEKQM